MKLVISVLLLSFCIVARAQTNPSDCYKTIETILSKELNQARQYWVGLPSNYDTTVNYPVIYLLDADVHFDITLALTKELTKNDKMPPHILVGIPSIDHLQRWKDLSFSKENPIQYDPSIAPEFFFNSDNFGGGEQFLRYIEEELMPSVEENYNTNGYNILVGHSLGGYFGAYAIPIQKKFQAFQLYDPSVFCNSNEAIVNISKLPSRFSTNVYISSALAEKEGDPFGKKVALDAIDSLIRTVKIFSNIRSGSSFYPKEGHLSMYMYSLIDGFTFLYDGFSFGYILPTSQVTLDDYFAHYEALSKNTGFDFSAPVDGIRWVAYANYHQGKWNEALKAYSECEKQYAHDYEVNLEMAECYSNTDELKLSLKYYKICKELNPNKVDIDSKISELERKLKN